MITLGIETSGRAGSIAVIRDGVCLGERILSQTGRRHARTLVAELRDLLTEHRLTPGDVDVTAVSIGPGSFTGLRVGVVCAKTFAYATEGAVVAVDTFQAVAAAAPADVDRVDVIGDAQRGDLYVGRYHRSADKAWERVGDVEIVSLETWLTALTPETVVSGPAASAHAGPIAAKCRLLATEFHTPRAEIVARIGERQAAAGQVDDHWSLAPKYIRRSAAEEKADAGEARL